MRTLDPLDATPMQLDRPEPGSLQAIRGALLRKGLADAHHRSALARRFGFTGTEVLAIQHLALAGGLTPGELGARLQLSSGGTTGLIYRLEQAGHVRRTPNDRDRRSTVISLTPSIRDRTADALAPLVEEIDALIAELSEDERAALERFFDKLADVAERHASRIARDADEARQDAFAVPLPPLWA
jgi:DNA-binding MarR family transcriptional regulator